MHESLLPLGAILKRELIAMLREKRPYSLMAMMVFLVGGGVAMWMWFVPPELMILSNVGVASRALYYVCSVALLLGIAMFVPAAAANAVVSEVQQDTFEMLTLTGIGPFHFVAGKMLVSATYALLLTAGLAPLAALSFFGVGLDIELLALTLFIAAATTLQAAAAGTFVGCFFRKSTPATVGAQVLFLYLAVGSYPTCYMLAVTLGLLFRYDIWPHVISVTSPGALAILRWGGGTQLASLPHIAGCGAVVLFEVLVLGLFAYLRVRSRWHSTDTWDRQGVFTRPLRVLRRRIASRAAYPPLPDRANPVFFLEARYGSRVLGLSGARLCVWSTFLLSMLWFLLAMATHIRGYVDDDALIGLSVMVLIGSTLLAPAFLAGAFTREAEQDTLAALAMTTLSPKDIVLGKLRVGLLLTAYLAGPYAVSVWLYVLACCPIAVPFDAVWPEVPFGAFFTSASLVLFVGTASVASITGSLLARRTRTSISASYGITMLIGGGLSLAAGAAFAMVEAFGRVSLWRMGFDSADIERTIASLSPVGGLIYFLNDLTNWYESWPPYFISHVLTITIAAGLIRFCIWRYPRWLRRMIGK